MTSQARTFQRFWVYCFYEFLLCVWLAYVWTHYEGFPLKWQFHDVHPIQHAQEAHLGIAALLYLLLVVGAYRNKTFPEFHAYFPILCVLLWGMNRELDGVWERFELDLVYDSLKFVTAIPAILFVAMYRRLCWEGLMKIRTSRGFLFLVAGIGGYLAAQIVGEGFEALEISRNYERAAEESLELLFSACFVFSGVEAFRRTESGLEISSRVVAGKRNPQE